MKEEKDIFIMGDSYSTYEGYIPKGYFFYYSDIREDAPVVKGVEKTWWKILSQENNFNIVLNDSFSGSTISNTVREGYDIKSSFISRIDKYIEEGFFDKNKIDTMFIFGGTNDSWIDAPIGEIKYSDYNEDDLKCVLPAFCYLIQRAKEVCDDLIIIINCDLKDEITNDFIKVCEKYNVKHLYLREIDKQNGHPTQLGMRQISNQVKECLNKN